MAKTKKKNQKTMRFSQKLVLFKWLLNLFEVDSIEELAVGLKGPEAEGFTEDNFSRFYGILTARLFDRAGLTADQIAEYDQNIVRYWKQITENRKADGHNLYPKYFQYLSLLFTEIYLDMYFANKHKLLEDLNDFLSDFDQQMPDNEKIGPYAIDDLNKLAFWKATGSGKTLIMHINLLQYKNYLAKADRSRELNNIILLTPNEGLSNQHLEEFKLSGIDADLFDKARSTPLLSMHQRPVEIIDIHKLADETGDKTVAVESFEGNNLVLVDEGHRGATGGEKGQWMRRRNALCEEGFSFEYSATFGQAIKGDKKLVPVYAKCIVFDYSYKFFFEDGYGKDYRILNLEDDSDENQRIRYMTACLLAFYQQQKIYSDKKRELKKYLIENPLWIFVGGSVNAVRTVNKRKVSDVTDILLFLSEFVSNKTRSISLIDDFIKGRSGLHDTRGNDLLSENFIYLAGKSEITADIIYHDILKNLFNSASPGLLHIRNLKGSSGEIAIALGENEAFGVINVGDSDALCKLCRTHNELVVSDEPFSHSLFDNINTESSKINILVGSRKFSEGWSSWRVCTMGLMNIGKSEGAQIIQLFGRGVRLKGLDFSLKRSSKVSGHKAPAHITTLETLNVFGIHADYMRQFKEYLIEQGLPVEGELIEFILPVIKNLGKVKLKTIKLKEGISYKKQAPKPMIGLPDEEVKKRRVEVNWYPKVQSIMSYRATASIAQAMPNQAVLSRDHIAFIDIDEVYFELARYKNERTWYNLNLSKENTKALLDNPDWYKVFIPEDELELDDFSKISRWQQIAVSVLKKYIDRYYNDCKSEWEKDHLEYQELTEDDPNFTEAYELMIDASRTDIINRLKEIKELIDNKTLKPADFNRLSQDLPGFKPILFGNHLYQPLLYKSKDCPVEIKPVHLVDSEKEFVLDLKKFCEANQPFFDKRELYLLRNKTKGKGIGFFEAGNFYPDFMLWLVDGKKQYISFIDPKGIRNLNGIEDPKIEFYQKIKDVETRLNDSDVILNSFIVSETEFLRVNWVGRSMGKTDLERHHVFFMKDDKEIYIQKLFDKVLN